MPPNATEIERAVSRAVDALTPDLISFIQALVRLPSVTGKEAAVQHVVADKMTTLGLAVDVWEPDPVELAPFSRDIGVIESFAGRPNVVGVARGNSGGRSLILNGHVDVVDAGDPARWSHPPFAAEIDGDRLYGRGACDMKAGVAANIFAVAALKRAGIRVAGDVIIQSVISEEDGGAGTLAALLRGPTGDAAIITEPTNQAVLAAQGGSAVFRVHVPGRSAHGAVRNEGVSAIEKFAYLHRALQEFEAQRNRDISHPLYAGMANKIPISIGVVHAGTWPSSVAESLVAEGRAGLVPGETLEEFGREFVAVVDRAADADEWLREHRPRVEWFSGQFEPAEIDPDAAIVQAVCGAHRSATGRDAVIGASTYGADMRHFVNFAGIPCLMYGAGDVRVAHYTDEFVPLSEVVSVTTTLAFTIADWCGIAS